MCHLSEVFKYLSHFACNIKNRKIELKLILNMCVYGEEEDKIEVVA